MSDVEDDDITVDTSSAVLVHTRTQSPASRQSGRGVRDEDHHRGSDSTSSSNNNDVEGKRRPQQLQQVHTGGGAKPRFSSQGSSARNTPGRFHDPVGGSPVSAAPPFVPKASALVSMGNELRMTLGNPVRLYFTQPKAASRSRMASRQGHPSMPLFSCMCRLHVTPTDLYFEQVYSNTLGATGLGSFVMTGYPTASEPTATTTTTTRQGRKKEKEGVASGDWGEDVGISDDTVPSDVLCVPRSGLTDVVPLSAMPGATRSSSYLGVCIHTRCFQCLYVTMSCDEDQTMLLEELRGERGRLVDLAFEQQLSPLRPGFEDDVLAKKFHWKMTKLAALRGESAVFATLAGIHIFPPQYSHCLRDCVSACFAARSTNEEEGPAAWFACDMETEFQRQEFSSAWRVSDVNREFGVCGTYSPLIIVPAAATDEQVAKASKTRNRNRGLVATYYHKSSGAAIVRCAQANLDDLLLRNLKETHGQAYQNLIKKTCPTQQLQVFDLRAVVNAMANVFRGGGCEGTANYGGIGNINAVRESFNKLFALLHPEQIEQSRITATSTPSQFLVAIAETQWLDILYSVLTAAVTIARTVAGTSSNVAAVAVVHCSDGWDRTSQVCALAQILLDPFFRTVRGLCVLIDKEFVQFGHMFAERCSCYLPEHANRQSAESSPIFLMFLDCLVQLVALHPTQFQYNETFLLFLADAFHSGVFGTFAFDSYADIDIYDGTRATLSLWVFVEHMLNGLSDDIIVETRSGSEPSPVREGRANESDESGGVGHSPDRTESDRMLGATPPVHSTLSTSVATDREGASPHSSLGSPASIAPPNGYRFYNPLYSEADGIKKPCLLADVSPGDVNIWRRFYFRYSPITRTTMAPQLQPETMLPRSHSGSDVGTPTGLGAHWHQSTNAKAHASTPQETKRKSLGFFSKAHSQSCQDIPSMQYGATVSPSSPGTIPRSATAQPPPSHVLGRNGNGSGAALSASTPTAQVPPFPSSPVESRRVSGNNSTTAGGTMSHDATGSSCSQNQEDETDFEADMAEGSVRMPSSNSSYNLHSPNQRETFSSRFPGSTRFPRNTSERSLHGFTGHAMAPPPHHHHPQQVQPQQRKGGKAAPRAMLDDEW